MRDIGLIATDTGEAGGKETGQKMTHIVEDDGRFSKALVKLFRQHPAIIYQDRAGEDDPVRKKKAASKTKYTCPGCGLNAWAKPEAPLVCGACQETMEAEEEV
jgi:rubrerythrin